VKQFRIQKRGGLGLRALPTSDRNGVLVSMAVVGPEDDLMVVTDHGTIIRVPIAQVRAYSRAAKGVKVIDARGQQVVASYAVPSGEPETPVVTKDSAAPAIGATNNAEVGAVGLDDPDMDEMVGSGGEDE